MAYCTNCGAELGEGQRFCGECGAPVSGRAANAAPPEHGRASTNPTRVPPTEAPPTYVPPPGAGQARQSPSFGKSVALGCVGVVVMVLIGLLVAAPVLPFVGDFVHGFIQGLLGG